MSRMSPGQDQETQPRVSASPWQLFPALGRWAIRIAKPATSEAFPTIFSAIEIQPLLPLRSDSFLPVGPLFDRMPACARSHGAQHIEIMDLAQRILQIRKIPRPFFVTLRQEILHCVPEAFIPIRSW